MNDLESIIRENEAERQRLRELTARLTDEDLGTRLSNGWTVAGALAHLAFWDWNQLSVLRQWEPGHEKVIPMDVQAVNEAIHQSSKKIPPRQAITMALLAANEVDGEVERIPKELADLILLKGQERLIHRAPHRRNHLDKIEKSLRHS
ncbi:MAG TPA: DinB family protein [bacterium]|nr:DinB family protein [bacterium]